MVLRSGQICLVISGVVAITTELTLDFKWKDRSDRPHRKVIQEALMSISSLVIQRYTRPRHTSCSSVVDGYSTSGLPGHLVNL